MNFQALHFSSEEDSDDSSVESYESSDEEGGMVGGAFPRFGNNKKDPETESFLKKLFYYSHMDGENEVFLNEIDVNIYSVYQLVKKRDKMYIAIKRESQQQEKQYLQIQLKSLQKQIDDLQQTNKIKKFDIRILHYIDVLMKIKTCEENSSSFSRKEFDETNNKVNKDSLKWLYHEYITVGKERKIFYENVLFHDASFRDDKTYTKLFNLMNYYYFLYFSCYKIHEDPKYPDKMKKKRENIGSTYDKINEALILNEKSEFIKTKIKKSMNSLNTKTSDAILSYIENIKTKIEKIMNFLNTKTRDAILSYIENIQKKIDPYDIQLKENSSTEGIARIQNQISNFLNDEYITNENNKRSNNPMITQNDLKTMESLDETIIDETIIQFWKDNQYENISFDKKDVPNNYPFLIINQRKHTFPRFSIVFDKDTYAENVKKWFELCHTYEFTPISAENTMGLTEQYYNGLNVTFAYDYEEYYPFEIRFHTLETFMMKEIPHYHLETLVEGIGAYKPPHQMKLLSSKQSNNTVPNLEIIQNVMNPTEQLFNNLIEKFEPQTNEGKETSDNENLLPIDFRYYVTVQKEENENDRDGFLTQKKLIRHEYKTIPYFFIAKYIKNNRELTGDFQQFYQIYTENYTKDQTAPRLYKNILHSIFEGYLTYIKNKLISLKGIEYNEMFSKYYKIKDDYFNKDATNRFEFIKEKYFFELPDQLQKICNDNMILKHFIPNDSGISFDIKKSKTPPEEPFNPFPNLLGYELIVNKYMEFVMNSKSVETTPLQPGGVEESKESVTQEDNNEEEEEGEGEGEGSEMKSDESQDDKNKPPEQEYDVYFQHVNERVYELYKKLEATKDQGNNFKVTIASDDGNSCSLGTGFAETQWLAKGYHDEQYQAFITHLHDSLKGLKNKYKNRVVYGRVSGSEASDSNYHVWGANSKNWDLSDYVNIPGSGQADDMGEQKEGVFGIVTTPLAGPPELKNINNKDKIDKIIDELKELAKENNSSAESENSQPQPIEGVSVEPEKNNPSIVTVSPTKRTGAQLTQEDTEPVSVMKPVVIPPKRGPVVSIPNPIAEPSN
jgi:hypothetical protein